MVRMTLAGVGTSGYVEDDNIILGIRLFGLVALEDDLAEELAGG